MDRSCRPDLAVDVEQVIRGRGPDTYPAAALGEQQVYDNDPDLDLYVANRSGMNRLFRNEGGGNFTDVTSGPLGDTGSTHGVAWGDADRDGDLDLYIANFNSPNKLLRNDGGDTFAAITDGPLGDPGRGFGGVWGDVDNDGDLDLYLVNDLENRLLRNDGDLEFVDVTSGPIGDDGNGRGAAWGDYDNDGDLDLYLSDVYGVGPGINKLFRNDGACTFADVTASPLGDADNGTATAWADCDNDGDLDLYLAKPDHANRLFENEGAGQFIDATEGAIGDPGRSISAAFADYDQDGDVDLYVANEGDPNRLFRNEESSVNHWIHVDLVGEYSNASGIGARIRVTAGGIAQIREVSGGSGDLGQNSLTAEFGLGLAAVADVIRVRWPSGIVQDVMQVQADQRIVIYERDATGIGVAHDALPVALRAHPSSPNPFAGATTIRYDLPARAEVGIQIFDISGALVRTLIPPTVADPGIHAVTWDGWDDQGRPVKPGVYFYRLRAGNQVASGRMVVVK